MDLVRAGLDARIHDRTRGMSEFSAVVAGLKVELSQRVRGRPHHKAGAIEEVDQVGIVVYSVEDEVVLFRSLAVRHEVPGAASARVPEGRSDTGSQLSDVHPVAPIKRSVVDRFCVDHLSYRGLLRFQQGGSAQT